ncbi:hypothetical protein ACHOLT_00975 [Desulfitobacterium sp. Sab5]|uniref:hypothetical protein n=1 Tax=Desulfitobacterium nosdiversum TaxID=3375356 RepID=UPI003CFA9ED0
MLRKGQAVKSGRSTRYKCGSYNPLGVRLNTVASISDMDIMSIRVIGTRKRVNKKNVAGRTAWNRRAYIKIESQEEINALKKALVVPEAQMQTSGFTDNRKAQMITATKVYCNMISQEERDIDRTIEMLKRYIR